jgi:hypothetical protein
VEGRRVTLRALLVRHAAGGGGGSRQPAGQGVVARALVHIGAGGLGVRAGGRVAALGGLARARVLARSRAAW